MQKIAGLILFRKNKILVGTLVPLVLCVLGGPSTGCTTVYPHVDLVLAREAFAAATEVDGAKYAPSYYHKAEETFRKGMALYKDQKYPEAVNEFKLARIYAERAENSARLQRQKAGEEGL